MAFNLSGLTAYTKTNEQDLSTRSFFESKTASRMQILTGVKSSIQVPTLSDTLVYQDGSTCGFSASGDTTISARVLTVGRIKVNKEWCMKELETKYTQLLLSPGSNYESLPGKIDQAFVETIIGTMSETNERGIWQGNTASSDPNLNKYDGLVKIINSASGTIQSNASAFTGIATVTAFTAANIESPSIQQAKGLANLYKETASIFEEIQLKAILRAVKENNCAECACEEAEEEITTPFQDENGAK
jgi:hypothetical protein